jgi:hypothetical protein
MLVMIDLNRIRSIKTLEEMKDDLLSFINDPDMLQVYTEDFGWGEEDLDADVESANYLLERVEHRIQSLTRLLKKTGSLPPQKSEKEEVPSEQ